MFLPSLTSERIENIALGYRRHYSWSSCPLASVHIENSQDINFRDRLWCMFLAETQMFTTGPIVSLWKPKLLLKVVVHLRQFLFLVQTPELLPQTKLKLDTNIKFMKYHEIISFAPTQSGKLGGDSHLYGKTPSGDGSGASFPSPLHRLLCCEPRWAMLDNWNLGHKTCFCLVLGLDCFDCLQLLFDRREQESAERFRPKVEVVSC